ncbi:hypothetical protein ACIQCF_17315 [Streptomyces sp. NPDC088353]|uniref:hypothetical protein n=1 Tax=unclassified Streptomyces TaxID=2593676 RepID=UPI0036BD1FDB
MLKEERFAQAAEVLGDVVEPAALALGSDNREVLDLRMERAAVRFLGGDYRRALPEFDALAGAFSRIAGPTTDPASWTTRAWKRIRGPGHRAHGGGGAGLRPSPAADRRST